tara:strand:+ start:464 stop:1192 length:729 start_codon:yes stop_codon:yes gene_type:complete
MDHFWTKKTVWVGSHRGLSLTSNNIENTINAFDHPSNQSADFIELDCIMTADNQLIMYHDQDYQELQVTQTNLSTLHKQLPHLELLKKAANYLVQHQPTKGLYLELKPYEKTTQRKQQFLSNVYQLIADYKLNNRCLIASMDPEIITLTTQQGTKLKVAYIQPEHSQPIAYKTTAFHCVHIAAINQYKNTVQPLIVWEKSGEQAILQALKVYTTPKQRKQWCNSYNIAGFCTNTVDQVKKCL